MKHLCYHIPEFILFDYHHEHGDLGHVVRYPDNVPELWVSGVRKIVYYPQYRNEDELEEICEIAKGLRNLVLIVEEADCVLGCDLRHPLRRHFRDTVHTESGTME